MNGLIISKSVYNMFYIDIYMNPYHYIGFLIFIIFIVQLIKYFVNQKVLLVGGAIQGSTQDTFYPIKYDMPFQQTPLNKNTYIFWHIATIGSWYDIVTDQLNKIISSSLINHVNNIYIGVISSDIFEYQKLTHLLSTSKFYNKFNILFKKNSGFENQTLNALKHFCNHNPKSNILYIHSKGVTRNTKPVADWRNYMEYFLIEKYHNCFKILNTHDHCGVNWTDGIKNTWIKPHYSGNFWWATSDYIKTLPDIDTRTKFDNQRDLIDLIEFWIGRNSNGKHYSFYQSITDQFSMLAFHYKHQFPRIIYSTL